MSFAETIMAETSMKCSSPELKLERNFRKVPNIEVGYLTQGKYLVSGAEEKLRKKEENTWRRKKNQVSEEKEEYGWKKEQNIRRRKK